MTVAADALAIIADYGDRCFVLGCKEAVVRTWTTEPQPWRKKDKIVSSCEDHSRWLVKCALPPGLRQREG